MDAVNALPFLFGITVSFLASFINRPDWDPRKKGAVVSVLCVVFGVTSTIISGSIDGIPETVVSTLKSLIVSVGLVAVASQTFYSLFKTQMKNLESDTRKEITK